LCKEILKNPRETLARHGTGAGEPVLNELFDSPGKERAKSMINSPHARSGLLPKRDVGANFDAGVPVENNAAAVRPVVRPRSVSLPARLEPVGLQPPPVCAPEPVVTNVFVELTEPEKPATATMPSIDVAQEGAEIPATAANMTSDLTALTFPSGAAPENIELTAVQSLFDACKNGHADTVRALCDAMRSPASGLSLALLEVIDESGMTPLRAAAAAGQTGVVELLIDNAVKIEALDEDGMSALLHAARHGNTDTMDMLLLSGADRNRVDDRRRSAMMWAARTGEPAAVRLLIVYGAPIDLEDDRGRTALFWAVKSDRLDVIVPLLEKGVDVEHADHTGMTPLMVAAQFCSTAVVSRLLEAGARVGTQNGKERTAFLTGVRGGCPAATLALLQAHCDPNLDILNRPDTWGMTPLMHAASRSNVELVTWLLEAGAQVDVASNNGDTALTLSLREAFSPVVALLLGAKANPNLFTEGDPPLLVAAKHGRLEALDLLLAAGANKNNCDHDGKTALMIAAKEKRIGFLQRLCSRNVETIGAIDHHGRSVLMHAVIAGSVEATAILLAYGADARAHDRRGRNALMYAASRGELCLVRTLLGEFPVDIMYGDNPLVESVKDCLGYIGTSFDNAFGAPARKKETREEMCFAEDKTYWTVFHHAAYGRNAAVIEMLLDFDLPLYRLPGYIDAAFNAKKPSSTAIDLWMTPPGESTAASLSVDFDAMLNRLFKEIQPSFEGLHSPEELEEIFRSITAKLCEEFMIRHLVLEAFMDPLRRLWLPVNGTWSKNEQWREPLNTPQTTLFWLHVMAGAQGLHAICADPRATVENYTGPASAPAGRRLSTLRASRLADDARFQAREMTEFGAAEFLLELTAVFKLFFEPRAPESGGNFASILRKEVGLMKPVSQLVAGAWGDTPGPLDNAGVLAEKLIAALDSDLVMLVLEECEVDTERDFIQAQIQGLQEVARKMLAACKALS
jgi:ankyrin repeat protein